MDLKHGFILLDVTKNNSHREIPIDNTLREMFNKIPHSVESVYVFTDRNGRPYKEATHSFATASRKAGIRDFRFHDCRHTASSLMVMAGIDLVTIKELLGHKSFSMNMRYAHLAPRHKHKAVNTLDEIFSNGEQELKNVDNASRSENFVHNFTARERRRFPKSLLDKYAREDSNL